MSGRRRRILDPAVISDIKLAREAIDFADRDDAELAAKLRAVADVDGANLTGIVVALTKALEAGSPAAAGTLGHLADYAFRYQGGSLPDAVRDALPALFAATSADNEDVRVASWKALVSYAPLKGRDVVELLISKNFQSARYNEIATSIDALRACGIDLAGMAVKWLVNLLDHADENVLELIIQTFAFLGTEASDATERLVALIVDDRHTDLRGEAAKALVAIDRAGKQVLRLEFDKASRPKLLDALRLAGAGAHGVRKKLETKWRPRLKPARTKLNKAEVTETRLVLNLMEHHGFGTGSFNPEPIIQTELAKRLKCKQPVVSRHMEAIFGKKPMAAYKAACLDEKRLNRLLGQRLDTKLKHVDDSKTDKPDELSTDEE